MPSFTQTRRRFIKAGAAASTSFIAGPTMAQHVNNLPSNEANADLSNWRTSPFNRWAFHNVGEFIPTAEIENAPQDTWELSAAPVPLNDFRLALPNGGALNLEAFLKATSTDAIVVMRDGRIVFEAYDNGNTEHTPHILMSATKSVVALIAGILHKKGDLHIDALVSDYVPEIAKTAYQGATIRHLLDMRTGIVLDESQLRAYEAATNWVPTAPDEAQANFRTFFENMTAFHKDHGGPFSYVSANTDLLGWAIERATGQTFASLLSALLWKPMGAEDRAYITVDRKGLARCTGGLCAAARDFARIGRLVAQGGSRGSVDIVPAAWIEDIAEQGDHDAWTKGEWGKLFTFAGASMSYRSGWYVIDDEPKTLFAMGIHGQNLFIDRDNRLVIAKLSSLSNPLDQQAIWLTHKAVPEFRRCLLASPE